MLAMATGLRESELLGLRWCDAQDGYIVVRVKLEEGARVLPTLAYPGSGFMTSGTSTPRSCARLGCTQRSCKSASVMPPFGSRWTRIRTSCQECSSKR